MYVKFPNYKHSLVNLAGTIMKEFDLDNPYPSNRSLDKILKYNYSNIIVIVYEEISAKEVDEVIEEKSFLGKHRFRDISTVFPGTKDISLRAIEIGKLFPDRNDNIISMINSKTEYQAYGIFPTGLGSYEDRDEMYKRIINLSTGEGKKYIYAYCDKYDLNCLNEEIEYLSDRVDDSVIFVVSNRGKVLEKMQEIDLEKYSKLLKTISDYKIISGRSLLVKVKDNEKFINEFNQVLLNKKFRIFDPEEAEYRLLLNREDFFDFKYDYVVAGKGDNYFKNDEDLCDGGITEDEIFAPMFIVCRKKKDDQVIVRRSRYSDYDDFMPIINKAHNDRFLKRRDLFQKNSVFTSTEFYNFCEQFSGKLIFIYILSEKIIGYIQLELGDYSSRSLYNSNSLIKISNVYVLEEYRRRGVATRLYQEVVAYAKKLKTNRIEFEVWDFDEDTKNFISSLHMNVQRYHYEIKL